MNLKKWNVSSVLVAVTAAMLVLVMVIWAEQSDFSCLLCTPRPPLEKLSIVSYDIRSPTNLTLTLKNDLSPSWAITGYIVTDPGGDKYSRLYWDGPSVASGAAGIVPITIGSSCGNCTYQGTAGAFNQFNTGSVYTVTVVTARNNEFPFSIIT